MGWFTPQRDPLEAEMSRLEREVRKLQERTRRLEAGLGQSESEDPPPSPPSTRLSFPDLPQPTPTTPHRPIRTGLRVQQRQIKLQVLAMGAVCVILGVLVARVLGWM